jgi:7,8-dihydropterin-6-yl-methyl-4-(beta-D-ribofuranosyl)aminobenzene 5'-phosphate synthase
MIITALSENTSSKDNISCEHGLSLHISLSQEDVLFDCGAGPLFYENAQVMGIDIKQVDIAIISHGHYDHGGGIRTFMDVNHQADIYVQESAFGDFYSAQPDGNKYIGLDKALLPDRRIIFTKQHFVINDHVEVFSGVSGKTLLPAGNNTLLKKDIASAAVTQDDFLHEQNLVINENGKTVLIAGCAHMGIVNIVEHWRKLSGRYPDHVIGGFHLYNRKTNWSETPETIALIADALIRTGAVYHTCHCTGLKAYGQLSEMMPGKINYLSAGDQIKI